jgi:hypothetical protein
VRHPGKRGDTNVEPLGSVGMQTETFRYLMSALAQVYGALIFGVGIFLVLRYQRLKGAGEHSREALARLAAQESVSGSLSTRDQAKYRERVGATVAYLTSLSDEEMGQEVEQVIRVLDARVRKTMTAREQTSPGSMKRQHAERLEALRGRRGRIESQQHRLRDLRSVLGRFGSEALWVLGVPALLCWLFSFALLFADRLGGPLQAENVAGWAVVLAGAGLGYLVLAAGEMLGDVDPQNGEEAGSPGGSGQAGGTQSNAAPGTS